MDKGKIRKIVNEITHSNIGLFEEVFEEPLYQFLLKIDKLMTRFQEQYVHISIKVENILYSMGRNTCEILIETFVRFFVGDLYEKRMMLEGNTSKERYEYYILNCLLPNYNIFFSEESEMRRLLDNRIEMTRKAFAELLEYIGNDEDVIKSMIDCSDIVINDILFRQGDAHNCGRTVVIIKFDQNKKIVYKPHSLYNDFIFFEIIEWFNKNGLSKSLKHLQSIDKEEYGWQEYVTFRECNDEAEVEDYMYRLGCLLFITYVMGSSDLHMENFITEGAFPIIIDTETLFSNSSSFRGKIQESVDGWNKILYNSVFSSLLLPLDLLDGKNGNLHNLSGIYNNFSNENVIERKVTAIINKGTDEISFSEIDVSEKVQEGNNYVCLKGEIKKPQEYLNFITAGFEDTYRILMTKKEEFIQNLSSIKMEKGFHRIVFRKTSLYEKYRMISYHPYYIQDMKMRRYIFEHLKGKKGFFSDEHRLLVTLEIEQLMRDDIPYFFTKYTSKDVYAYGGIIKNLFSETIEEQFIRRIHELSEEDLYMQRYFIKCALITDNTKKNETRHKVDIHIDEKMGLHEKIKALIQWVYDFRERYHKIPEKTGECPGYYNTRVQASGEGLGVELPVLYDGVGSALFYLQLTSVLGDKYKEKALRFCDVYMKQFVRKDINIEKERVGFFTGIFSEVYLYCYLYYFTKEEQYMEKTQNLYRYIIDNFYEFEEAADVMSGYAGCIIFSVNLWKKNPEQELFLELAHMCGDKLLEMHEKEKLVLQNGFSHGNAGIAAALIMLGTVIQKESYYQLGLNLIKEEQKLFNLEKRGWENTNDKSISLDVWCYGSAGIIIGRVISLNYAKDEDKLLLETDIERCITRMKNNIMGGAKGEMLCHGMAGNLDVLLWYAQQKKEQSLYDFIHSYTEKLVERILCEGILFDNASETLNISFMLGLTGIGYYLERYLDESIPSVLALEI